jgi:hypothetical protein
VIVGQAPGPAAGPPAGSADTLAKLHSTLLESNQTHIADAVQHSTLTESPSELVVTTPKMYVMYLKQPAFEAAVRQVLGKQIKITIRQGADAPAASAAPQPPPPDEVAARALSHPEVQRFQETFPGSQVRAVRNLKEG